MASNHRLRVHGQLHSAEVMCSKGGAYIYKSCSMCVCPTFLEGVSQSDSTESGARRDDARAKGRAPSFKRAFCMGVVSSVVQLQ